MYGYIYETTNLINGKKYIGKSAHDKFNEKYHGSGKHIRRALEKYGEQNFKTVLLEWCKDLEELNQREFYWINKNNAVEDRNYYNIIPGGAGGWYYDRKTHPHSGFTKYSKHTNETRRKMRENHWSKTGKYDQHTRKYTQEEIDKFKENHWSKLGHSVWNKGLKIPKDKQSISQKNFPYNTKGSVWMNKDGVSKRVHKDKINEFLENGYSFGRNLPKETLDRMSKLQSGRTPWNKNLKLK